VIFPARRLLWLTGLTLLPAGALPLFLPGGVAILWAIVTGFLLIVFTDAASSTHKMDGYSVHTDPEIRAALGEEQPFFVRVEATQNRPLLRRLRIAAALPEGIVSSCDDIHVRPPSQSFTVEMKLKGLIRGEFPMREAYVGTPSWLGLWELRRTLPLATKISVQPALKRSIQEAVRLLATRRHSDQRLVARNGRGREFEHLREFTPGDELSQVDWKATARRQAPTVRQYRIERTQDVYVCVDASRFSAQPITTAKGEQVTLLDEYVTSTIMLEHLIRKTGDRFGLMTFSNRVHHFVRASGGRPNGRMMHAALYPLTSHVTAPSFEEACTMLRAQVRRRSLFLFLTHLGEPQVAATFLKAVRPLARQHIVIAACPTDRRTKSLFHETNLQDAEEIYADLAGHLFWKRLQEVRSRLAEANVRMNLVAPDRLGLSAASAYLDVKERQLL
jgi:uncharacterized protein (DUF58 family)